MKCSYIELSSGDILRFLGTFVSRFRNIKHVGLRLEACSNISMQGARTKRCGKCKAIPERARLDPSKFVNSTTRREDSIADSTFGECGAGCGTNPRRSQCVRWFARWFRRLPSESRHAAEKRDTSWRQSLCSAREIRIGPFRPACL